LYFLQQPAVFVLCVMLSSSVYYELKEDGHHFVEQE